MADEDKKNEPQPEENDTHEKAEAVTIGHMEAYLNEIRSRFDGLTQMLSSLGEMHEALKGLVDKSRKDLEKSEGEENGKYRY